MKNKNPIKCYHCNSKNIILIRKNIYKCKDCLTQFVEIENKIDKIENDK